MDIFVSKLLVTHQDLDRLETSFKTINPDTQRHDTVTLPKSLTDDRIQDMMDSIKRQIEDSGYQLLKDDDDDEWYVKNRIDKSSITYSQAKRIIERQKARERNPRRERETESKDKDREWDRSGSRKTRRKQQKQKRKSRKQKHRHS
jgi:topoisomerase IA-like protein